MINKFFIILFFLSNLIFCQLDVVEIKLPKKIRETSGLEYYKGNFITINDSGGKPRIFSFLGDGSILNKHSIKGAINRDWEDLTADENYIYISDTGNNYATRKDLTIYKIDKDLKLKDSILIQYSEQKVFDYRKKNRYDAEALASVDSMLLLFSKDRKTFSTQVYSVPKIPGNYSIVPLTEFFVECLITAADYNKNIKTLALTGYLGGNQYLFRFLNFDYKNIQNLKFEKYLIPVTSAQIEAVKIYDLDTFWLTTENEGNGPPRLFKVCLNKR